MSAGVVIAGGGLAAQRSAEALRRGGYEGRVRILSNELHAPYDRPQLSGRIHALRRALLSAQQQDGRRSSSSRRRCSPRRPHGGASARPA